MDIKNLGFHLSPSDERDWPLSALPEIPAEKPEFASLRHHVKEVLDQQDAPVCVAATFCAAFQAVYGIRFSMRWFYWQCKKIDGLPPNTDGTTFRAALQVAVKQGLCPEELCPTFPGWRDQNFTPEMDTEASKYRLKSYARLKIGSLEELERALAAGYFVMMGSIVDSKAWMDGDEWLLVPEGSWLGGHATLGVEYDETLEHQKYKDFLVFQNSWGTDNGRDGFYYMAEKYAAATSVDLPGWHPLTEAWAIEFETKLTPETRTTPESPDNCAKWAQEARDWAVEKGITDGTKPKENVTREQLWTMLYRAKEVVKDG